MCSHPLLPQLKEQGSLSALQQHQFALKSSYQLQQQQQQQQSRRLLGTLESPIVESNYYIAEDFDEGVTLEEDAQHAALWQHQNQSAQSPKQEAENQSQITSKLQSIPQTKVQKVDSDLSLSPATEIENNLIDDYFVEFKMKKEVDGSHSAEVEVNPQRRSREQQNYYQKENQLDDYVEQDTTIDIRLNTPQQEFHYSGSSVIQSDQLNAQFQQENQTQEYGDNEKFRDENGQVQDSLGLLQDFMTMLIDTGQLSPSAYTPALPPTLSFNLDALKPQSSNDAPLTPDPEPSKQLTLSPQTAPQPEPEIEKDMISKIIQEFRESNTINIPQNLTATTGIAQQSPDTTIEAVSLDNIQNWGPQSLPLPLPFPAAGPNEVSLPPLPPSQATPLPLPRREDKISPTPGIGTDIGISTPFQQVTSNTPRVVANQEASTSVQTQEPAEEEYEDMFLSLFAPLNVPSIDLPPTSLSTQNQQTSTGINLSPSLGSLSISDLQLQQFLGQAVISAVVNYEEDETQDAQSVPMTEPQPETELLSALSPQVISQPEEESPTQQTRSTQSPQISQFSENLEVFGISPILQAPPELIQQLFLPQKQSKADVISPDEENVAPSDEDIFDDVLGGINPAQEQEGGFQLFSDQNFSFPVYPLLGGNFESSRSLWQKVRARDSNGTELEEQISSFVSMLQTSGLSSQMCEIKGGITIFAPINEVFDRMLEELLILQDDINAFLKNMETVNQILKYHIIQSKLEKISEDKEYNTLLEDESIIVEHKEIFGQVIARPPNSTEGVFAFIRTLEGYLELFPCGIKTVLIDEVLFPFPYPYIQG